MAAYLVVAAVTWLTALHGYNNITAIQLPRLEELYQAAHIIGPGADWGWLRRVASCVRAYHQSACAKQPRMVSSAELYSHGANLMAVPLTDTPRQ